MQSPQSVTSSARGRKSGIYSDECSNRKHKIAAELTITPHLSARPVCRTYSGVLAAHPEREIAHVYLSTEPTDAGPVVLTLQHDSSGSAL